mgnify:CR=1 FL=1
MPARTAPLSSADRPGVDDPGLGRRLGVDGGAVRVGVALSDPGAFLATPLVTLARDVKTGQDLRDLAGLVTEHDVVEVSGSAIHPALIPDGDPGSAVPGTVFTLTEDQLARADGYEVDAYRRVEVPLPSPALGSVGRLSRRFGFVDYSPEQMRFLNFGRVVDTITGWARKQNYFASEEALSAYADETVVFG